MENKAFWKVPTSGKALCRRGELSNVALGAGGDGALQAEGRWWGFAAFWGRGWKVSRARCGEMGRGWGSQCQGVLPTGFVALGIGWGGFSACGRGRWGRFPNAKGCCRWDDTPSDSGGTSHTRKGKGKWATRSRGNRSVCPVHQSDRRSNDLISIRSLSNPIGRIEPEPWSTNDRTDRSRLVFKTMPNFFSCTRFIVSDVNLKFCWDTSSAMKLPYYK